MSSDVSMPPERYNCSKRIKNRFLAGLTVVVPSIVTIFVIVWLLTEMNKLFNPFSMLIKDHFHVYIPDIGLIPLIIIIFIAGFLVTNVIGKNVIEFFEKGLFKIPIASLLYKSTKQWINIFSSNKASFKKSVLVKFQDNKFVYGFLVSETTITNDNNEKVSYGVIYVPTNQFFLGINIIAKKEDIFETNMSIEDSIQSVLSAGISFPKNFESVRKDGKIA